jgi:type I restriction enzyme, S subunit
MTIWKTYKLGELVDINKKSITKDFGYKSIEYVDTSSVTENKFEIPQLLLIDKAPSRAKRIADVGDVIISTVRPIQKHYGYIKKSSPNTVYSTGFAVVSPKKNINSKYLFYFLTQEEITLYLNSIAESGTTTFPAFKPIDLLDIEINLPDIPTQRTIAEILSSLDDKIELNNQMNKTLEEMAQAVFKQWFVDFDFPDKNGNPYKSSGGEMVESELGMIPKRWKVKLLSELMEIKYGKDHKKLAEGNIPIYGSGGIMRYGDNFLYDDESILIPRKGTLSNLFYINKPFWTVDTMFYSIIKIQYSAKYFYYFIKDLNLAEMNVGSAVPSMTTKVLNAINMLLPSDEILKKNDEFLIPIFENIEANIQGSEKLKLLRDLLLPKLMSGELDVSEAESLIEESEVLQMAAEPEIKYNKQ